MKRLLAIIGALVCLAIPASAAAAGGHPSYCGTTPYDVSYKAVYEYPSGSYWQAQIAAFPAYYAAHNAKYLAQYGC